ncbi:MAG: glycosyltransferase family 4 protein [Armatimonadota bacterium]|nr:glycosyltransferase family 4 protein [bacterium]
MRVLEAITPSRIGGAEVYVAELCEQLPKLGIEVELFVPSGRPFVDYAASRGIESVNWKTHGKIDPITIFRLAKLIKSHKIDIVHTHLSTASLLGAMAAKIAGVGSVAHVHGMNSATCFKRSTAVIAVSEAVKTHLCEQGLDPNRVHVVHNGVDLGRFRPVNLADSKRKLGYDPGTHIFGVFGRLSEEKGQQVAIEAMSILLKNHPNARLVLGGDGKNRGELAHAAESLGIVESVEFKGFISDVRTLMSACDGVIVPSIREGFGLAAVEAMALGRPVIASRVGGLPEIVVPDETGFLISPADPNELACAMESLIANESSAAHMGKMGRDRAQNFFDLKKQIQAVAHILQCQSPKTE